MAKKRIVALVAVFLLMISALPGATAMAQPKLVSQGKDISIFKMLTGQMLPGKNTQFSIKTTRRGRLELRILDGVTGKSLRRFYNKTRNKGTVRINFNGKTSSKANIVAGKEYIIQAKLVSGKRTTIRQMRIQAARPAPQISSLKVSTKKFLPDGGSPLNISMKLNMAGKLYGTLYDSKGTLVTTLANGASAQAGGYTYRWGGKLNGKYLATGNYTARWYVVDASGRKSATKAISFTYDAPPSGTPNAIWSEFTKPITVVNSNYLKEVYVTSRPGGGTRRGYTFGTSAGVRVISQSGKYSLIEFNTYRNNKVVRGYIETKKLKTITPSSPFGIYVDQGRQKAYVYRNGVLINSFTVSTGKKGHQSTPSGTFIIPNRKPGFTSGSARARYAVRVVGRIYFHEIPHINGNYSRAQAQLGTRASAGCIRVPRGTAKWIYDTVPNGAVVIIR